MSSVPASAAAAVLVQSEPLSEDAIPIKGPDFTKPLSLTELLSSYQQIGFQASSLSTAVNIIQNMVRVTYSFLLHEFGSQLIDQRRWRLSDVPIAPDEPEDLLDPQIRASTKCTIFLGFTSNLMSSGLREIFRFLTQHNYISAIATTAGGIEEDFIKCLGKTYLADFHLDGASLRKKGLNRIGNLVVPNDNYCAFEDWVMPILDQMLEEQKTQGVVWSPSTVIHRLGKEINNEESVYYWAYKVHSLMPFFLGCADSTVE
jgi:deoxyhypusine synthase